MADPCATRRDWLKAAGLAAIGVVTGPVRWGMAADSEDRVRSGGDGKKRPNIPYIMADDHTSQAWGCYGSRLAKLARTKHVDRIAAEGALLRNCFCTNSICVPSRATVLTGQYSHLNGAHTLAGRLRPQQDNAAKHLEAAGYSTAIVGKWHLEAPPAGSDHYNVLHGQGRYHKLYDDFRTML